MPSYTSGGSFSDAFAKAFADQMNAYIYQFGTTACNHPKLGFMCVIDDTDGWKREELHIQCLMCAKLVAIPRKWIAKDVDGENTRKLVAYAFEKYGNEWKKLKFPWEFVYNNIIFKHSLTKTGTRYVTRFSEVGGLLKAKFGMWLMWLWLYCCSWEVMADGRNKV